jgi:hypothetical protein
MFSIKQVFAFLCIAFVTSSAAQTNYYVSNSGSNQNNGLSVATAFKTITYAATVANHGDTINVLAGTYVNSTYGTYNIWKSEQTVRINNKNSSSGNYLVIRPYQSQSVNLKGDGDFIFMIRNSSYIHIEGFEIEGEVNNIPLDSALKYQFTYKDSSGNIAERVPPGTPPNVVDTMNFPILANVTRPSYFNTIGLLTQNSHHLIIKRNIIHHLPGTGLRIFKGDYINLTENEIHNSSRRSSVGNHGLVVHSSTSIDNNNDYKIFISRNKVYLNYNEVYSWSELKTKISAHIDEGKGISMQKNTVANGWIHGKIRIDNNIAYKNGFSGFHSNEGIRIDFINNTAYLNSVSYAGSGSNLGISVQDGDSIGIYNNISIADSVGYAISINDTTRIKISNNLVSGRIDNDVDLIDVNTIFADPKLLDTAHADFSLTAGSPAINAALASVAPVVDYTNAVRSIPDIGAYEYFIPVPVNLVLFKGSVTGDRDVLLKWLTANEINLDHFIVERTTNKTIWKDLAKVKANNKYGSEYLYYDKAPESVNHYRLKMVDYDGNYKYSPVFSIEIAKPGSVPLVYPNPTNHKLYIEGYEPSEIEIFTPDGKNITSMVLIIEKGGNKTEVDLSALKSGVYFVSTKTTVTRIIVNH